MAAFLSLLRVLARDFERRAVVDLLRSGRVNLSSLAPKNLDVNRWDRWSRSARIVSGLSAWQGLREFVHRLSFPGDAEDRDPGEEAARRERDGKSVSQLLAILEGLKKEQDAWLAARTFDAHAAFLGGLARRWISPRSRVKPGPEDSLARVLGAIEAAGVAREAAAHVARSGKEPRAETSIEEVEEVMRSAAEARELRIRGEDSGGIRVLDLMQARGLGHRILIWIGFHDGAFPRRAHADYYLGDGAREALAKLSQKPLAKKLEAADEERLLLAMALASAKDRLTLSYQRADDDGQKLARSSALREVARVFTGKPDAGALLRDEPDNPFRPERISSHPGERAVDLATSTRIGMIEPEEAVVGEAVRARKGEPMARAVIRVLRLDDAYKEATLSCVERLERFEPADGSFDGATGIGIDRGRALYPTAIERLARCPLSFFLRDVLGLRELDDKAAPHRIEKHILGSAAHDALAEIYATLERDELFRSKKDPATRAAELIEPLWRKHLEKAAGPSFVRLRGLFALLGDRWLDSLREFVLPDVEEIRKASIQKLETEKHLSVSLSLAEGAEQKLAGRMDRVIRANDSSAWLDDYKTGRVNKKKLEPGSMLRGVHLQLPLYREIVASLLGLEASQVRARLLGVGPDSEEGPVELKTDPEVRKGILETIQVALELAIKGHFPLHRDSQEETYCNYCGYRRTCRRSHEPTRARLEGDPRLADFRDMKRKQKGKPLLANVRAHPEDDGQEGGGE